MKIESPHRATDGENKTFTYIILFLLYDTFGMWL